MPYRVSLPPSPERPWGYRVEGRVQLVDFDLESGMLTRRGVEQQVHGAALGACPGIDPDGGMGGVLLGALHRRAP